MTIDIRHKVTKQMSKERLTVTIRLNDECKNGHADFAITADGRELYSGRWQDSYGGCCHDEILKHFPAFKIFVDLHLSDSNGAPMYAIANGFYHAWNTDKSAFDRQRITCEYLRCSKAEYKQLIAIKDKTYFHYMIEKLGLVKQWKKQALTAIKELERLSGKKWDHSHKWPRAQYEKLKGKDRRALLSKIKAGYFTQAALARREKVRKELEYIKKLNDITLDADKEIAKINKERRVKTFLVKHIHKVAGRDRSKRFNMSYKSAIYYNHANKIGFNWSTCNPVVDEFSFKKFCDSITGRDFQSLPQGISFQLGDKGPVFTK